MWIADLLLLLMLMLLLLLRLERSARRGHERNVAGRCDGRRRRKMRSWREIGRRYAAAVDGGWWWRRTVRRRSPAAAAAAAGCGGRADGETAHAVDVVVAVAVAVVESADRAANC